MSNNPSNHPPLRPANSSLGLPVVSGANTNTSNKTLPTTGPLNQSPKIPENTTSATSTSNSPAQASSQNNNNLTASTTTAPTSTTAPKSSSATKHDHHSKKLVVDDGSSTQQDDTPRKHHSKSSNSKSKSHKPTVPEVKNFHDYGYEVSGVVPGEVPISDIILKSSLASRSGPEQIKNIVHAFNYDAEVKQIITTDPIRGNRIPPGVFQIFSLNNKAILQAPTDKNIAKVLYPLSTSIVTDHGAVQQNSILIEKYGKHVLNIPTGSIAKARIGTRLFFYGEGPHFVHDANFVFDPDSDIFSLNDLHIHHGTYHILTVPSGKIARITLDGNPILLTSRPSPYVFNTTRFSFAIDNSGSFLEETTTKLVINGALKRLIVDTGEVAVISNNGQLEIIEPNTAGTPIIINNPLVRVEKNPFVSTNIQTIIFPSGNKYENAQTADGVRVKMKLMITYKIVDPKLAIRQLNSPQKILEHIEYCALTDMRNATQSSNFYAVQQTESAKVKGDQETGQYYQHIQDELKVQLKGELLLIGVELGRLTFEEFLIDDKKVQEQRSTNAQAIASTTAQVSNLEKERTLKIQTEETALQVLKIQLEQKRNNEITSAQTELEKTEIQLKMEVIKAEAAATQTASKQRIKVENDLNLKRMVAQNALEIALLEAQMITQKADAARQTEIMMLETKGEMYRLHPKLYELQLAKVRKRALLSMKESVLSESAAPTYYGTNDTLPLLFAGTQLHSSSGK